MGHPKDEGCECDPAEYQRDRCSEKWIRCNARITWLRDHGRSPARIGVDVGRVLVGASDTSGKADSSFLDGNDAKALAREPEPYAFEVVGRLWKSTGGGVWIVSKCGTRIESLTRRWLDHHRFHETTGVPREHLRFCKRRPEKRNHAAELQLTHFIDDRLDVLEPMVGLVPNLLRFGRDEIVMPPWATAVRDWPAVLGLLTV